MNGRLSLKHWFSPSALVLLPIFAVFCSNPLPAQIRIQLQPPRRPVIVTPPSPSQPRAPEYRYGARSHTDALVRQLVRQANAICLEMHQHYRHNPGFRETYREMYTVLERTKHLQELTRDHYHQRRGDRHGDDDHFARDLYAIDRMAHHVADDIRNWRSDHPQVPSYFPGGNVPGRRGGEALHLTLREFNETLHHLMEDYGVRSRRDDDRRDDRGRRDDGLIPPPPPDGYRPPRPFDR